MKPVILNLTGSNVWCCSKDYLGKTNPADDLNMINMAARSLLIETNHKLILIDTGLGDKQSERFFLTITGGVNIQSETSIKKAGFKNEILLMFFLHTFILITAAEL